MNEPVPANPVPAFHALALQISCHAVNQLSSRKDAEAVMQQTIAHAGNAISGAVGFHGDIDLVVLPEYFLTGHPSGESLPEWRALAAISLVSGREIDALSALSIRHGIFLAGNAYEADPNFPDFYFQSSFITEPDGNLVLKYRRLVSMYTPSSYDVLDKYLHLYGNDSLFPVANTSIGRLAAIASEEILYPEIARCLAMRGAEIFVHSSSEAALRGLSPKNLAKRARAMENMAYIVSANSAGIIGGAMLQDATDAGSQIVHYNGHVMLEADSGESMNVVCELDIEALRRARRRVGMSNFLARQPTALFAEAYAASFCPHLSNNFGEDTPERIFFRDRQKDAIQRLSKKGII